MGYKIRRFSANSILNTRQNIVGFKNHFNYDQDMERLGKGKTLRELSCPNIFNKEMAKLKNELDEMKKQQ